MDINATLFGQMITFLLFVWFTKKFVWPPVFKALKDREGKIADGLAAAERGRLELAHALEEAKATINKGKEDAASIIVDAKKQSDNIIDVARQHAHEEGQRIIHQAHAEVEHMIAEAKEQLRKQMATIALAGAEKILKSSIDSKAHQSLLNSLAEEI